MSPFVNTTKYWNIVSKCEFLGCFGLPPFEILAGEAISGLPPDISAHIGPRVDSKLDHKRVKWRRSKLYGSKVSGVQACINYFLWIKVSNHMFLTAYYTVRVVWDDNGEQIGEGTNLHKKRSKSMRDWWQNQEGWNIINIYFQDILYSIDLGPWVKGALIWQSRELVKDDGCVSFIV